MKTLLAAFFCQESYQWNKFQEHVFICKHKKNPAASSKTQDTFDAELGNFAPDTISMSRPLEPTNAPLSVLLFQKLGYMRRRRTILQCQIVPKLICDPKPSSPFNLDSCQSVALKTYLPEVEVPTVSNIDSSIAQVDLDAQLLKPSVPDFCQGSAKNPAHLESSFNTSRNPDVEILEPPILDSCQTTQVKESTVPTLLFQTLVAVFFSSPS